MSHTAEAAAKAAVASQVVPPPTDSERQNLHRLLRLSDTLPYTQHRLNEGAFCSPLVCEIMDRYKNSADLRLENSEGVGAGVEVCVAWSRQAPASSTSTPPPPPLPLPAPTPNLSTYSTIDNRALREELARLHNVDTDNVFVSNGSGMILKIGIPGLIKQSILHPSNMFTMVQRVFKYVMQLEAFPIVTTSLTYSKVPRGAMRQNLKMRFIPLLPENNFELDIEELKEHIAETPCLVYLANPNNPTGNVLVTPETLIPIVRANPGHYFWVDEAYYEFLDPEKHESFANYVQELPNLVVSHSMSFAYGIAAAHVGYVIASPKIVQLLHDSVTMYGVSKMAEECALAALCGAPTHLPWIRSYMAKESKLLINACRSVGFLKPFPTVTNFFLVQISDDVELTAYDIQDFMTARGTPIRTFDNFRPYNFDKLFRITIGLPSDNLKLAQSLKALPQPRPAVASSKL